jgi:hypothetical protein
MTPAVFDLNQTFFASDRQRHEELKDQSGGLLDNEIVL